MPRVFEGNLLHRRSLCRHHATLLPQEAGGGGGQCCVTTKRTGVGFISK